MMSGTSSLPRPLRLKWQTLTGGKRILERYGTSEFNSGILTPLNNSHDVPDVSLFHVPRSTTSNTIIGICWSSLARMSYQALEWR